MNNIIILSALIYLTQGLEGLPASSIFYYLKETLHFTPEKIMLLGSVTGLAWLCKPIWGYLSDNYLTKKTWIILSLISSISIALFFGLSPILPMTLVVIMLALNGYNAASRDVAIDGLSVIQGKETNTTEKIQAVQWTSITVASLLVGIGGGYIAEHFTYKVGFLCLIPLYLIVLYFTRNYKSTPSTQKRESFVKNLLSYKELITNKQFLLACLFLFLYKYSPSFGIPLMYAERDLFRRSKQWIGTLSSICSGAEILGAFLFYKFCKNINIKKWLYISVFLGALTSLAYLYFTPVTSIVYGIVFSFLGMMIHLVTMSFVAKNSLPGKEATSFALLCSISNLASTASSLSGAWLLPLIGLSGLIILSSLTSFLCLPLLRKLDIK